MTAYDNSNSGVIFPNDRKTAPNQPDFTGNVILSKELIMYVTREIAAGREPKLALKGWKKTSKAGKGFVSLVAEEPWDPNKAQVQKPAPRMAASPADYDPNDDIPF